MGMKRIKVAGKDFHCLMFDEKSWMPKYPLKFERVINNTKAYLVDAKGNIWIYGKCMREHGDVMYFYDTCTRDGIMYIMFNDPIARFSKPSDVFFVLGIDDPRGVYYDEMWKCHLQRVLEEN